MKWSASALFVLLGTTACASPAVKQARFSDWSTLRQTLSESELKAARVRRIAAEVLRSEVKHSQDLPDRDFIPTLRACSGPLASALRQRMKQRDGTGAEAAMLLVETDRFPGSTSRFAEDDDGAWRALSVRGQWLDAETRQASFADPDERVRSAALAAAAEAKDPADVEQLLEVARLDPAPVLRSRAIFVLGQIAGPGVLQNLKDRYAAADEPLRLTILSAYGGSRLYSAGGREQLQRVTAHERGLTRVTAASRLARDADPEVHHPAVATLVRAIQAGSEDERRLALRLVPLHPASARDALLDATKDDNPQVALIAWARLLSHDATREAAESQLLKWAAADDALAHQALAALSAAKVSKAKPRLVELLTHPDSTTRIVSGKGLVRLGALSEAAPLLGDDDAQVRRRVACEVVGRPAVAREN